jgi:single-stranded-DNA-specific exonuclease
MKRYKYWDLTHYDREEMKALAAKVGISPVTAGILWKRGLRDENGIREFLFGKKDTYYDPFLMKDMRLAAERILQAVDTRERIAVYGDYDVDGITASSLLYLYLTGLHANVSTYIPKREGEGYGLNNEALQSLHEEGVTLVVTVDCGISGVKEVAEAPRGMDIIITDHHRPPELLPMAFAIVNPKQADCGYPFKGLSGVGVAFKVCQALEKLRNPEAPLWEQYTELVALGTVADIVPLQDENRALVKRGMKAMETTSLTGLRKLLQVCRCYQETITTEKIGFILAPRLNAVGRLEHAQLAVELLITKDEEAAERMAGNLNDENAVRQEISRQIFTEAEALLEKQASIGPAIVLAGQWDSDAQEGWHPGVIGIVASRLVDKYYRPVILISISGDVAKGSCRSIHPLDMYDALDACSADLIQFGGHSQAAGLTLESRKIEDFQKHFTEFVRNHLQPEDYQPRLAVDIEWDRNEELTLSFLHELQLLEPFGCENPAPLFMLRNAEVHNPRLFGQELSHLRFFTDIGPRSCHCIMWQGAQYQYCLCNNAQADIAFKPRINFFNNTESINLDIVAFRMDMELHDYRRNTEFKETVLSRILRSDQRFTVFINKNSADEKELSAFSNVKIRHYGELCDETERQIIFYELPEENIFRWGNFPVGGKNRTVLYILYNLDDWYMQKHKLLEEYPDRNHLADAYRFIKKVLQSQAVAKLGQLKYQAEKHQLHLKDYDLQIFRELDFFRIQGDELMMGSTERRQLETSPTYAGLCAERDALLDVYQNSLRIACARIQSLRKR